ncbi:bifunctional oligoribonuclease/PAP phosphatase NrnA [Aerococcaceae bacterium NML201209]|nr:bifunctional oligoribonuclease/PAP phosphatase NrnA [Aerococcaceae bacterium NML201209]MCW6662355.1 bifunctional oligoribonuclease/PAP phosphatase NrnA [Aerococcaceae bacterium NML190073]
MTYLISEQVAHLYRLIEQTDTIIVHRHVRPDPDAIGSQLGLKALLRHRFPSKRVLAAGTTSAGLKWLGEMDKVSADDYAQALVIICDTANQPRIDGEHYQRGTHLAKIDHHPDVDAYGEVQLVHTQASSCSEIIIELSRYLGERLPMTTEAARLLYAGVVGDTGRFLFNNVTQTTFEAMAFLMPFDFAPYQVNDQLRIKTMAEAKFQGYFFDQLTINDVGVAHLIITQDLIEQYGMTEEQTNSVVGLPGEIEGVLAWVTFVEQAGETPFYRCRIRSKGPVINEVAAKHHGGGHPMASGANAYSLEEVQAIVEELSELAIAYRNEERLYGN